MNTKIGKITDVNFGMCGYQDAEIGLSVTIAFKGSGVQGTYSGGWANNEPSEYAGWTKESTYETRSKMLNKIIKALEDAGVKDISKLQGKLVRCEFEHNRLLDWEILTED